MTDVPYREIEGIRCYAPAVALDCADYPSDGFDVSAEVQARSFWCRTRNRVLGHVFARFTDRTRPIDVLEIGCGIGGVITSLRGMANLRLTGSEVYIHGLRYAKAKMPDVDFIQLDATDIPFRSAFDVIGAFDVIEHIDEDQRVMAQVHKALRPDGLFVITVPQYQWMWSTLDDIVHHKRRYSRRELTGKLRRAGFDPIYTTSFVTALFPFMLITRLYDRVKRQSPEAMNGFSEWVTLPEPLSHLCDWASRIDEGILKLGATLPFGGSLLVVARRRSSQS